MSSKKIDSVRAWISVALLLCASLAAIAQGTWELGRYRLLSGPPSPPLRYSQANSGGLGSYDFVSRVGGVAFSGVAIPSSTVNNTKISLRYDPSASDGRHLKIIAGNVMSQADLSDWMLVPIAQFADSEFDSCVSLFGPRTNATSYDIVYHEKLRDTLLGLRLLQADLLLFDLGETWHLPKFNGRVVLGLGEVPPTEFDEASAVSISSALNAGQFQSWVMTDQGERITFDIHDGGFEISGSPYYYFWTSNVKEVNQQKDTLYQEALRLRSAGRVAEHNRIVGQINSMRPVVTEVSSLTNSLKNSSGALRRLNGPVYNAATNTMRFSAFFRYVKKQSPADWKIFLTQLGSIEVQPAITTPTAWAR